MHKLLARQIKRVLKGRADLIPREFLEAVSDAYEQADEDRNLLERAMELTSEELLERHEALNRSLALVRATLESTDDGLLVVGRSGGIRSFNQRFVEIWKHPPEILESRDMSAIMDFLRSRGEDKQGFDRI